MESSNVEVSFSLESLLCPLGLKRIIDPVVGRECRPHSRAFDRDTFLAYEARLLDRTREGENKGSKRARHGLFASAPERKVKCPVCGEKISGARLVPREDVLKILRGTPLSCTMVELRSDGSFSPVDPSSSGRQLARSQTDRGRERKRPLAQASRGPAESAVAQLRAAQNDDREEDDDVVFLPQPPKIHQLPGTDSTAVAKRLRRDLALLLQSSAVPSPSITPSQPTVDRLHRLDPLYLTFDMAIWEVFQLGSFSRAASLLEDPLLAPHLTSFSRDRSDRSTLLMAAAAKGAEGMVKRLLEEGAEKEAQDIYGNSAADFARLGGHQRIYELLTRDT